MWSPVLGLPGAYHLAGELMQRMKKDSQENSNNDKRVPRHPASNGQKNRAQKTARDSAMVKTMGFWD